MTAAATSNLRRRMGLSQSSRPVLHLPYSVRFSDMQTLADAGPDQVPSLRGAGRT